MFTQSIWSFFFHLAVFVFFHGTNVNSRRYNITLFLLNVHCKVLEIFHSNVGWGKWAKVTHPGYGFRPDERRRIVSSGFFSLPRSTSGDQPTLKDVNSPRQFRPCFKISMSKKDIFELRGNEDMKLRSQYCTQLKQLWKESLSTSGLNGIWTMISAIPLQCSTRNVLSSQLRAGHLLYSYLVYWISRLQCSRHLGKLEACFETHIARFRPDSNGKIMAKNVLLY